MRAWHGGLAAGIGVGRLAVSSPSSGRIQLRSPRQLPPGSSAPPPPTPRVCPSASQTPLPSGPHPLLQAYLSEQGYFNSADGLSGYFGAVTREALQNWQRDQGLRISGVFNEDCKWAYLRQQVRRGRARRVGMGMCLV